MNSKALKSNLSEKFVSSQLHQQCIQSRQMSVITDLYNSALDKSMG